MAESEYCDDYYDYMNNDCDGDCEECNHTECDEHPHQKHLTRWQRLQNEVNAKYGW